jgi:DNA-3-methyladenine glycosylase II
MTVTRELDRQSVAPGVWELAVRGSFDLDQTLGFGFGQRPAAPAGPLRMAFCVDGLEEQVATVVSSPAAGVLRIAIEGDAAPDRVLAQVARILSVDVDGTGYDALGRQDELVGRLQQARPGLRPPLFHSAYEALCWSVLSARRPAAQMAELRTRLSRAHGRVFRVDGVELAAFPTPDQLLSVAGFPGLPEIKLQRLHAVAEAARAGDLDTDALRRLDPQIAAAELQKLPGIGPFYSELVTVRALGHTDLLPAAEVGASEIAGSLVGRTLDVTGLAELARSWSPWRTWVCVAVRAAGPLASDRAAPRHERGSCSAVV